MKFIELTSTQFNKETGKHEPFAKFMKDFESGWEIHDRGKAPAHWTNEKMGANHNVFETYEELKHKFIKSGLMIDLDSKQVVSDYVKDKELIAEKIITELAEFGKLVDKRYYNLPIRDYNKNMKQIVINILENKKV